MMVVEGDVLHYVKREGKLSRNMSEYVSRGITGSHAWRGGSEFSLSGWDLWGECSLSGVVDETVAA